MSKFSLVCSAYKSEVYLQQFLENLNLFNNAKDLTLYLVLNDPNSLEKKIISKASDLKYLLQIIEVERESISKSINRGFKLCETEFLGYLDVDDLHPENSYELMINTLDNCEVTYGDYEFIQKKYSNKNLDNHFLPFSKKIARKQPIFGPTHFFRKSIFDKVGYWDEQLVSAGDFDWQIRASAVANVKKTNFICSYYNFSPLSASRQIANSIENLVLALRYQNLSNVGPYLEYLYEALKYDIQYCHFNNSKNSVSKYIDAYNNYFKYDHKKNFQESFGVKMLSKLFFINLKKKFKFSKEKGTNK
jgi:hypothetical protein